MRIYSGIMHNMKIIFQNLGKLVLKIEIDLGREWTSVKNGREVNFCIMQYHYKYAFFEIFTILKSDFPKNYSIIDFF